MYFQRAALAAKARPERRLAHADHGRLADAVERHLDALIAQTQRPAERVRERRLADAGHVLDQQVPLRQQRDQRGADLGRLSLDDRGDRRGHLVGDPGDLREGWCGVFGHAISFPFLSAQPE